MIMNKKNLVVIGWLVVSTMMSAQSVYPGQHQGKMKKGVRQLLPQRRQPANPLLLISAPLRSSLFKCNEI